MGQINGKLVESESLGQQVTQPAVILDSPVNDDDGGSDLDNGQTEVLRWTVKQAGNFISVPVAAVTIEVAGFYQLNSTVRLASNSTGERILHFYKNSSGTKFYYRNSPNTVDELVMNIGGLLYLDVGDQVDVRVYQSSGGALGVLDGAFSVHRVSS